MAGANPETIIFREAHEAARSSGAARDVVGPRLRPFPLAIVNELTHHANPDVTLTPGFPEGGSGTAWR